MQYYYQTGKLEESTTASLLHYFQCVLRTKQAYIRHCLLTDKQEIYQK